MMRINKFLAHSGIASRRAAEELIKQGKIKINGEIVEEVGKVIDENNDRVEYKGKAVKPQEILVYIALNKPIGYVASVSSSQGTSVLALINRSQRIYPVGRLDKDSRGLLILTNDGDLAYELTHARFGCEKEYLVEIDKRLSSADKKIMEQGMLIEGKKLQPVKVQFVKGYQIKMILKEGVNRQIRRMLGRLGYSVLDLRRIRVGKLALGNLKEGEWRKIKKEDII